MFFQIARLAFFGFIVLTVLYVILSWYSRSIRRGKLETEFDEEVKTGDRDAFIKEGLARYDSSLRRKLILGVYVVPVIVVAALIYVTNFM
ncbi:hypothetical protein ACFFUT_03135 [Pseudohalocynthiibacter aestuariivivens]|jgi:Ca2+/Na+ antiporter|uniref:Cation/multidrug efflux pump n=1 Tax=Pseudohalocynthiibacter aestuariivivens TaxID=1591409 RepID=A0ABV5JBE5_9RHOB|nr:MULTISPECIES: hypothetical protein [Pseudohalocynthiibacter]MBS9715662.1 hypothetical protein [Pseudohalocynthiibacter aestuariivivens]MCK0101275.1 hypothetical protein [Pseudohalocynthiibacter sp. F2068]